MSSPLAPGGDLIKIKSTALPLSLSAAAHLLTYSPGEATAHRSPLTVHSSQFTAHSSQLTAHRSQFTAHSSQLSVHSSQKFSPNDNFCFPKITIFT